MTTPAPQVGEYVDVTIRGAEVMAVDGHRISVQKPWTDEYRRTIIDVSHPSVTVTPHAAGEAEGDLAGIRGRLAYGYCGEKHKHIAAQAIADARVLLAALDRLRAPAGIEAAIGAVKRLINDGDMGIVLHHHEIVAVLRAAAVHLDAGRAEAEAEEAWEEVANLKAVIEVIQCARADLEADNARLRGDRALALDDLRSASDTVAALRAELAEARKTIRALVGAPQPIDLDKEVVLEAEVAGLAATVEIAKESHVMLRAQLAEARAFAQWVADELDEPMPPWGERIREKALELAAANDEAPRRIRITPPEERNPVCGLIGLFSDAEATS